MTKVFLLTDYKGQFGYKYLATPHLSGFDKRLLADALEQRGLQPNYMPIADVDFRGSTLAGQLVLYTSAEDDELQYKSFIEDVVLGLQLQGAKLVPRFEALRAHHNKVFMEILRDLVRCDGARTLETRYFGTLDELVTSTRRTVTPAVVKPAAGAMSTGVSLARDRGELVRSAREASRSRRLPKPREIARAIRRPGYRPTSLHRRKFVVQELVPNLDHDWKVLVYGSKLYAVKRGVREGDFRASGSGILAFPEEAPKAVLDISRDLARALDVPWLSVDVVEAGGAAHVVEFQVLCFGTAAIQQAHGYFVDGPDGWAFRRGTSIVEVEFAEALLEHLGRGTG